jgi:hypothetical protein
MGTKRPENLENRRIREIMPKDLLKIQDLLQALILPHMTSKRILFYAPSF